VPLLSAATALGTVLFVQRDVTTGDVFHIIQQGKSYCLPLAFDLDVCFVHSPAHTHRAIKRIIKPMMGFKDFRCARIILSGIEVMHMIRKGQLKTAKGTSPSPAEQFYSMAM
jgi:hypothetical protein